MTETKKTITAKELYTELEITIAVLKEKAASVGIEVKVWNTKLTEEQAQKVRAAVKGNPLASELEMQPADVQALAKALAIDIATPETVSAEDKSRIKTCLDALRLAQELRIDFNDLRRIGSKVGIEIGRVGYKGLSKPEMLLLRAQYRTQNPTSAPAAGVVKAAAVAAAEAPKFSAPTGNKVVEARPRPPARDERPADPRGAAARKPGAPGVPDASAPTGRRRFEIRDTSYASQRSSRSDTAAPGAKQTQRVEMPLGPVTVTPPINLRQLSEALGVKVNDIMALLMKEGMMIRINDILPKEMIDNIGLLLEREIVIKAPKSAEELIQAELDLQDDSAENVVPRAPVVTVMGHVDHGKTSLLDAINRMDRAAGEAGGITQHIGAFRVEMARADGKSMAVTFIDTPGHEAFTAMRARGAKVTDVAVIVVAADDGVMQQTEEAINHAKAAEVEIVVAINKIDKPEANIQRTRQMLAAHNLMSPDWGGTTEICEVSATTGKGVPNLIQTLADLTELLELKANPSKPGAGVVLEAHRDEGRGTVATVLVQNGTMRKGQAIVAGAGYGRVRAMYDARGQEMPEAGPSIPVEVTGWTELPEVGANFHAVADYKKAQEIARKVESQEKELRRAAEAKVLTLESWSKERAVSKAAELLIVLKTDTRGSEETIRAELGKFSHDEVAIRIIHSAVGTISTNDVHLAAASGAIVFGFNTGVEPTAKDLADSHNVQIRQYDVIYRLFEDIHDALSGLLRPEEVEVEQGVIEVQQTFKASRIGTIAGCKVTDGVVTRNSRCRVYRENKLLADTPIESLKRFKDEVKEVRAPYECGIVLKGFAGIEVGDTLRPYVIETRERTLA